MTRTLNIFLLLSLAFGMMLPSVARAAESPLDGATVEVYKVTPETQLQIHRFDPPDHNPEKVKRPAVVFFFGGGWNSGSVNQFDPHARYLSKRGLVVFLADYRVKSRNNTTPRECVADGKSAIRWVRAHADRLGVDPDKIAAGGGSAGGHVAATTGICDGLDDPKDDLSVSSRPQALLLFNPVYDNGPEGYGHTRVTEWFPDISPAHNLSKDDPPTIVFLGSEDKLIPVSTAETFRDKQQELGIDSELHIYEGEPHGFFNLKIAQGKVDCFIDTVLKTDAFLVKHGFLEGEADKALLEEIAAGEKS